jgi:methylase of polypeptide subunit release factors
MGLAIQRAETSPVDDDLLRILNELEVADGVFKPNAGSVAMAECVRGLKGSFLDLGTGTGFVSLVISQSSNEVLATDCSTAAVECTKRNFRRFGVQAEVRLSDMFERVPETFNYVLFNPPVNVSETEFDRRFKNGFKSLLPTSLKELVSLISKPVLKYSIRPVIGAFYREASQHLRPGGSMLVNTLSPDIDWLHDLVAGRAHLTVYKRRTQFCIVAIIPSEPIATGIEDGHENTVYEYPPFPLPR